MLHPFLENLILQFVFGNYIRLTNDPLLYTYSTLYCEIVRKCVHFEILRIDMPLNLCSRVYVHNPFRSDLPWFPVDELLNTSIFNSVCESAVRCLRSSIVRNLNTYPKILLRRACKLHLGLSYWNEFLDYFYTNESLLRKSSYLCITQRDDIIVNIFLRSLHFSNYLPNLNYLF